MKNGSHKNPVGRIGQERRRGRCRWGIIPWILMPLFAIIAIQRQVAYQNYVGRQLERYENHKEWAVLAAADHQWAAAYTLAAGATMQSFDMGPDDRTALANLLELWKMIVKAHSKEIANGQLDHAEAKP